MDIRLKYKKKMPNRLKGRRQQNNNQPFVMDNIYTGNYSYRIYYGDAYTSGVVRANSESEAIEKFRTLTEWGKSGKPIVKVVKIG